MKQYLTMVAQDLMVAFRNKFHIVLIVMLAVTTAVVLLMPAEIEIQGNLYFYDASGTELTKGFTEHFNQFETLSTREELEETVKKERTNAGIIIEDFGTKSSVYVDVSPGETPRPVEDRHIIEDNGGELGFTYLHNGPLEGSELKGARAMMNEFSRLYMEAVGQGGELGFEIKTLGEITPPIGLNQNMIVILIGFEIVILGFLFVAVVLFQEKQEGSIRAYRITPGGTFAYMFSKVTVWILLTVLYGVLFLAFSNSWNMDIWMWIKMTAIFALAGAFFTMLGLLIALFFDNISDWFFPGVAALIINLLPQISYMNPAFAPQWAQWIPSYPILFVSRNILFGAGGGDFFYQAVLHLGIYTLILIPITYAGVKMKLMKEGR